MDLGVWSSQTDFRSVNTLTIEPRPPAATACSKGESLVISRGNELAYFVVPGEEDAAGVLCGVGKAAVYVLHKNINLVRAEVFHSLVHVCSSEPSQHIQYYVEVPLLQTYVQLLLHQCTVGIYLEGLVLGANWRVFQTHFQSLHIVTGAHVRQEKNT